jgi:hypothetical protein
MVFGGSFAVLQCYFEKFSAHQINRLEKVKYTT